METESLLYSTREMKFGASPYLNADTGRRSQLYCIPFTLSKEDTPHSKINKELLIDRMKKVLSSKGRVFCTVHWNSNLVIYWKEQKEDE